MITELSQNFTENNHLDFSQWAKTLSESWQRKSVAVLRGECLRTEQELNQETAIDEAKERASRSGESFIVFKIGDNSGSHGIIPARAFKEDYGTIVATVEPNGTVIQPGADAESLPAFLDMSVIARCFGIDYRVYFSSLVYACYVEVPEGVQQTEGQRIYDIFTALKQPLIGCKKDHLWFSVLVRTAPDRIQRVSLKATLREDDEGERCLVVGLPEE